MSDTARIFSYLKVYRTRFLIALVCMMCHASMLVMVMRSLKYIFDHVLTGRQDAGHAYQSLQWAAAGIILFYALKGLFQYLKDYLMNNASQKMVMALRNELYAHLQRLPLSAYGREQTGQLIMAVTNDVTNLSSVVPNAATLADSIVMLVCLVGYLCVLNWRLTLLSLVIFPFALVVLYRFGMRLRTIARLRQSKIGDIISHLQEKISGIRVVKAFSMEAQETERFRHENRLWFDFAMKDLKTSAVSGPVMDVLGAFGIAFIFIVGGRQIIHGEWSVGGFMAFVGSVLALYKPLHNLNGLNNSVQQAFTSAERVFRLLDLPAEVMDQPGAPSFEGFRHELRYDDVTYSYVAGRPVIKRVSFLVKKGQMAALVGPSGGGKSTIVDLALRFHDPESGRILVDGKDIREYALSSYRRQFAMVTQDVILFDDTVLANIAYGRPGATDAEVIEAARIANAHEFILDMPEGYRSSVGERGGKLSGGQQQRVAIARAILCRPSVLILDEATSSLDAESERLVQQALDRVMAERDRTTIVIAHRLSTVMKADIIIVVSEGKILDVGTHAELLGRCGLYTRLVEAQWLQATTPPHPS